MQPVPREVLPAPRPSWEWPAQPPTGAPTSTGPAFWGTGEVLGSSRVGRVLLRDPLAPASAPLGSQRWRWGGAPGGRASPSPASATPCVSQEMRAGEMSLIPRQGPPVPCGGSQALQPCWGESLGRWVWLPGLGGPDPGAGPPVPGRASWGLSSRTWVLRRLSARRLSGRGAGGWGHISPCCGLTRQVTGRPGWSPWDRELECGAPQQTLWFSPRSLVLSIPGPVTGASPTAAVCIPDDIAGGGAWAGVTGVLLWLPPPAPQPLCLAGCGGVLGGLVHAQVS